MSSSEVWLPREVSNEVAAYHEAGHVIAYLDFGIELESTRLISDDPRRWGETIPADRGAGRPAEVLAVVRCAGPMAEGLHDWLTNRASHYAAANQRSWVLAAGWQNGGQVDREQMLENGWEISAWQDRALALVQRRWIDVKSVAEAMLQAPQFRLSHAECIECVTRPGAQ